VLRSLGARVVDWSVADPSLGCLGGEHLTLTVNDTSSHLEFDCAHGDIPSALKPAADRTFAVSGTFVREHGGPIREDETVDVRPATYVGSVTGQTMQLTIRLTDPDSLIWNLHADPRGARSSAEVFVNEGSTRLRERGTEAR
jgi:hypothetical protein